MYSEVSSDGDLYRMQQEAIERARQTARQSPSYGAAGKNEHPKYITPPLLSSAKDDMKHHKIKFKRRKTDAGQHIKIFDKLTNENILILGLLALLLIDGSEDYILLIALAVLLLMG